MGDCVKQGIQGVGEATSQRVSKAGIRGREMESSREVSNRKMFCGLVTLSLWVVFRQFPWVLRCLPNPWKQAVFCLLGELPITGQFCLQGFILQRGADEQHNHCQGNGDERPKRIEEYRDQ